MLVRDPDYNWFHHSDSIQIDKQSSKIVVENGQIIVTMAAEIHLNNPALWTMTVEKKHSEVEIVYNAAGDELIAVQKDTSDRAIGESRGPFGD